MSIINWITGPDTSPERELGRRIADSEYDCDFCETAAPHRSRRGRTGHRDHRERTFRTARPDRPARRAHAAGSPIDFERRVGAVGSPGRSAQKTRFAGSPTSDRKSRSLPATILICFIVLILSSAMIGFIQILPTMIDGLSDKVNELEQEFGEADKGGDLDDRDAYDWLTDSDREIDTSLPKEYQEAMNDAYDYSEYLNMSKKSIYEILISEYGENRSEEAAQYAVDNIKVDWNANALEKAKQYSEMMEMSKSDIYDQLISEYGDQFTEDEAQYAIDHLAD